MSRPLTRDRVELKMAEALVSAYAAGMKAAKDGEKPSREQVQEAAETKAAEMFDLVRAVPMNPLEAGAAMVSGVKHINDNFVDFFVSKLPAKGPKR